MISTVGGYKILLSIRDGLPYIKMCKPTEEELFEYQHVKMTSDVEWDPSTLDEDWEEDEDLKDPPVLEHQPPEYDSDDEDNTNAEEFAPHELNLYKCIHDAKAEEHPSIQVHQQKAKDQEEESNIPTKPKPPDQYEQTPTAAKPTLGDTITPPRLILPKEPDYEALRPYFGWLTVEKIKATLKNTTQWFKTEERIL